MATAPRNAHSAPPSPRWVVLVPVKRLDQAKSRLDLPPGARRALALAMASDTVAAALAAPVVASVVVVTDDPDVARLVCGLGATTVRDAPGAGLNDALEHAELHVRRLVANDHLVGDRGVVALTADLAAATPAAVAAILLWAGGHPRSIVADATGTGTTVLTAAPGTRLAPRFGPGSRARHLSRGDADLTAVADERLRRDIDTLEDLEQARQLGLGVRTAAVLAALV